MIDLTQAEANLLLAMEKQRTNDTPTPLVRCASKSR